MRESKAELTDRLRREGRWDAFVLRREALKEGGTPAGEAWGIAAAEFAPEPDPADSATANSLKTPTSTDLSALRDKPAVLTLDAVSWTFEHMDADWVTPADAPSAGAWTLREWARANPANRTDFYRTFVPKLMASKGQDEASPTGDEPAPDDIAACDAGVEFVERLAKAAIRASKQPPPEGLPSELDLCGMDVEKLLAEMEAAESGEMRDAGTPSR